MTTASESSHYPFSYPDFSDGAYGASRLKHGTEFHAHSGSGSTLSSEDRKGSVSPVTQASIPTMGRASQRRQATKGQEDEILDTSQGSGNTMKDHTEDDYDLLGYSLGDGTDLGTKPKEPRSESIPAWSELKTKAGKERKRLPLACIACRRKKIRCSGEKPGCKHCGKSRIQCVYKTTTRKTGPRTDYMAMLDKRLRRMEDRIIKIIPSDEEVSASAVIRAIVKPAMPPSALAGKSASKKRAAGEAFGVPGLDHWARQSSRVKSDGQGKSAPKQVGQEDDKLMVEGRETLPTMEIREHLAEIFFENVYGQAYHLLHKPSYMRKLRADTLPPVLVLAVCTISARFSTHSTLTDVPILRRGEEWASVAREIVTRRYEWPNTTILTCLVILGLHEFGNCHGERSWSFGGMAIRMAFALQLHRDLEYDPIQGGSKTRLSSIDREIRRRLMWACFMMDRLMSCGVDRPGFILEELVDIQLPIKEKLFQLDMPGSTENLHGAVRHVLPDGDDRSTDVKENMGVAAYMVRAIALWGKITKYLNQDNIEREGFDIWDPESTYQQLLGEAVGFSAQLPDDLVYNKENLHLHETEGLANQYVLLHVSIQQNLIFVSRFAASSPTSVMEDETLQPFFAEAAEKAFAAASAISAIIKDADSYCVTAPFVGYCTFFSSTVHISGAYCGNPATEIAARKHLETNIKYITKMKRYWGMISWMSDVLHEEYTRVTEASTRGMAGRESSCVSIFQYGDWFDRFPHGASQKEESALSRPNSKEKGQGAVPEEKPQTPPTVEESLVKLSPAATTAATDGNDSSPKARPSKRRPASRTNSKEVTAGPVRNEAQQQLEPLRTDSNKNGSNSIPEHIMQRLQVRRQQFSTPRMNSHTRAPAVTATYQAISPISPSSAVPNQGHGPPPHHYPPHPTHNQPNYYEPELYPLGSVGTNAIPGLIPQIDRQLVYETYNGDMDPVSNNNMPVDWNTLNGSANNGSDTGGMQQQRTTGFNPTYGAVPEHQPGTWYPHWNMDPVALNESAPMYAGVYRYSSEGNMVTTPGVAGYGERRASHM